MVDTIDVSVVVVDECCCGAPTKCRKVVKLVWEPGVTIAIVKGADSLDVRPAAFDRQVLILCSSVWSLHFVFMQSFILSFDLPERIYADPGSTLARLLTVLVAILLSWVLHLFLKRVSRREPLSRLLLAAALSVPACALLTLANEFAFSRLSARYLADPSLFLRREEYVFTFFYFLWIFVAWSALYVTLANAEQLRVQERQVSAATNAAAAAQLKALQLQIHPHFLFNTLNALSGLVSVGRTADAEHIILNLSAFLRHTLATPPDQFVPLREELDVQRLYLDIERLRFGDRLQVDYSIDPECDDGLLPALLLQPLIENAVKHALAVTDARVTVTIGACRCNDRLNLWVEDARAGDLSHSSPGFGIGLANARQRLEVLFGARAALSAEPTPRGWISRISVPWMAAS